MDIFDCAMGEARPYTEAELAAIAAEPGSEDQIIAERERRLACGFDYDFGDDRGVHHIGTTEADLKGWDEVSKWASSAILRGQAEETLDIVTDTGPALISANDWQLILAAATANRQPIWQASFLLQAMDPIPGDFADDAHWPS